MIYIKVRSCSPISECINELHYKQAKETIPNCIANRYVLATILSTKNKVLTRTISTVIVRRARVRSVGHIEPFHCVRVVGEEM